MKKINFVIVAGLIISLNSQVKGQRSVAEPFLGMWALELDYENSNAGWLEVRQEEGYLDADILWRSGSVNPVDFTFVIDGELYLTRGEDVVREKDAEGNPIRIQHPVFWYNVRKDGRDRITGLAVFPERNGLKINTVAFNGKRIPPCGKAPETGKIRFGEAIELFNGKDLKGWELLEKDAHNGWSVVDGELVNDPVQKDGESHKRYGNLRTKATFEDFNLKLEVNIPAGSNSGIYLRGIYEVQVMDSYGKPLDSHNMGALYSRIKPSVSAEKPAGEWQDLDITLYKRHLTVKLNGKTVIDNKPVKGVTGGAMSWDEFSPGPIYLQGDHGKVFYRNIVLTPILK